MKKTNIIKLFGVIILVLVIEFSMIACDDGNKPESTNQTPVASDYTIDNLNQTAGSVTAVTITPKRGKSSGTVNIKYDESAMPPQIAGTYVVTFDVAAVSGWNAATNLSAGNLVVTDVSTGGGDEIDPTNITSIADLRTWLYSQDANTAVTAYTVKLNVSDLGGGSKSFVSAGYTLYTNRTKFVSLDLSGSTITSIDASAFSECPNLTGIILPNNVESIGNDAFCYCTSLTSINIPDSVTNIGGSAFGNCTSLTSITIPNNITFIAVGAFMDCTSLTSVTIPDSVTSIVQDAFYGCTSLFSVTIPNSVINIGPYAFYGCTSLASITIPDSVTWIGGYAFKGCISLTSVTFEGSIATDSFGSKVFAIFSSPFNGDLREKYLATGGGIGIYTRLNGESETWTKE